MLLSVVIVTRPCQIDENCAVVPLGAYYAESFATLDGSITLLTGNGNIFFCGISANYMLEPVYQRIPQLHHRHMTRRTSNITDE